MRNQLMISSVLIVMAFVGLFSVTLSKQLSMKPFSDLAWKNRIIVVFADDFENNYYKNQIQLLMADTIDLKERNLVVFGVCETQVSCAFGDKSISLNSKEIRDYYRINHGDAITILIGNDSGEKKRWNEVVDTGSIFGLIDSMPMRQSEIRNNKK